MLICPWAWRCVVDPEVAAQLPLATILREQACRCLPGQRVWPLAVAGRADCLWMHPGTTAGRRLRTTLARILLLRVRAPAILTPLQRGQQPAGLADNLFLQLQFAPVFSTWDSVTTVDYLWLFACHTTAPPPLEYYACPGSHSARDRPAVCSSLGTENGCC